MLSVNLFGTLKIFYQHQSVELRSTKAQELLSFLLLYRQRQHRREVLAEQLWGDQNATHVRKYLRQSLWQLQSSFSSSCSTSEDYVLTTGDWISINPDADIQLDVALFDEAYLMTQGINPYELQTHHVKALEEALRLYGGELLDGWAQNWCFGERERLFSVYLRMANKLITFYRTQQRYEYAIVTAEAVLKHDPTHEQSYQQLMYLHYLIGDRTTALRQYERCSRILHDELQFEPSQETHDLYEKIRTGTLDLPESHMPSGALLERLQAQLQSLTAYIHELQDQLYEA